MVYFHDINRQYLGIFQIVARLNNRSRHCEGEARSNPGMNYTYPGLLHCFTVRNDGATI